jgi:energy-converting hydrogenase Eha subunit G
MDMRVNPRLLGLTLVAFAALAVPAFAASRIAGLYVMDGAGFASDESEVEFSGAVASIAAEMWVVGDQAFAVTPDTEIQVGIVVGDVVKVHALQNPDGSLTAREIEIEEDGAVENIDDGDVDDGEQEDVDDDDVDGGEHEDGDDGERELGS